MQKLTFEQVMQFVTWARDQGSVHIKAPGGFELVFLPPETALKENHDPNPGTESSFDRWLKAKPLGM